MEVSSALRRIKRQFGDEYNVVINDQDILDWMHDAELDIVRAVSDNDLTIPIPVNRFPLQIPDKVNVKRLSVVGKSLTNTTLAQLDLTSSYTNSSGGPRYWYYQGGMVHLWPISVLTDESIVDVTYARTPRQMTIVAPYLRFLLGPTIVQVGHVASGQWKDNGGVNVAMELSFESLANNFTILNVGTDPAVPAANHFFIGFQTPPPVLYFSVSNGTATSGHTLKMKKSFVAGEIFKFRIAFDGTTDTAYLYRVDPYTGVEVLQDTSTHSRSFNKQTTSSADIHIGNKDLLSVPPISPIMNVFGMEIRSGYAIDPLIQPFLFLFDGMADLGNLFVPQANITCSSGHIMETTGGLVTAAQNEFTVPEVYHEDIVKFCLARAHTKNQNFRAAESEMEQYDRRVSTRRNEAQAPETALYKVPDPDDYYDYID